MMDNHNWRPSPAPQGVGGGGGASGPVPGGVGGGDAPATDTVDWRSEFSAESRDRIVSKILETLKKHLPVSGPEGLSELKKIAVRFEEKIYHVASSQPDYLRKISMKMLTMESKSQNTIPNAMPSNSNVSINKPSDSAAVNQPQMLNPGQQMPNQLPSNQSQTRQQLPVQNMQNNAPLGAGQVSGSLSSTLPPVSGFNQSNLPTVVGQNTNLGVSSNSLGNPMGQVMNSNLLVNPQRQMPARQSLAPQQQQQQQPQASQNTPQYIYQQQLHQLIKQKFQQQGNIPQSLVSSHLQQQPQQNLLQPTQQSVLPTSSVMQPAAVQSAAISGPQQSQQTSVHQPAQTMSQHQVMRHHQQQQQQQQSQAVHHQQTALSKQPMQTSHPQQHHQLTSQPPLQQSQLINQQNTMGDLQQQPQQQHQSRLLNQQSNLPNHQQQQLMSQQSNLSNVHQQVLAPQTNISGLHQQQQLLGTQPGSSGMQVAQHSVHLLGQSKAQVQQQMQGGGTSLLSSQGQQSQPTAVQQQLMSQMQQPPAQHQTQVGLQQTVGLQQQANQLQRDQRLQAPNSLLQQQNLIDQQKQLYQSQRTLTETSSMSVDTSQAGNANGGDWREETYQKLQVMKENYMPDLNEMYQKVMLKLQQHDSLPQQAKSEQIDKVKLFKTMLERIITFLQVPKSDISITFKDKLGSYEKQILSVLATHRPRKNPSGQLLPHHMQSVQQQQSQSQIAQMQSHENQMNPQLPQMNVQGSVATMQQNNVSNLQHNSMSSVSGVPGAQQNMMNSLQGNTAMESGQGNAMGSLTQVALGSMPQNPVSAPHQVNMGTISHQGGVNMLQSNVSVLQQNSNMIQHQHLKQQQDQQMMQTQQIKQQMQQRQMQQRHMQQQHQLHQQQQLQQQAKQQQQLPAQLQAHQMGQLHQMSDGNDVKMRPGMVVKQGVFPPANQRPNYSHQQLKQGTSFPSSSPQLLQTASPQLPQHSSPQIDQQNMLSALTKAGTPLQSANSPFVVPSPSTPLAPSPMPGDLEKPNPAISLLSNVGNVGHQATSAPSLIAAPSLAIGTPGISASPLLAEFSYPDGAHGNSNTGVSCKSTVTEQPIERLMRTVKALSSQVLIAGVHDIRSVVSMVDRIAGSAPGNGSRAAVGEDLVAMTKCRLQAKNFTAQDGAAGGRKMKRYTSAVPSSVASSTGSGEDDFLQFLGIESSDLESTATSAFKRRRAEVSHALLEEIRYINQRLIDTVVDIRDEEIDPSAAAAVAEGGEGVIVECSYNAVSLSPDFKTHYESAQMSRIRPLRLLVPTNYPHCSPLLLDKFPVEASKEYEDLSARTKARFSISLRNLSQPMSLKEIAQTWDKCARGVILEYAQQHGGGSFSSKYGTWESCVTAA